MNFLECGYLEFALRVFWLYYRKGASGVLVSFFLGFSSKSKVLIVLGFSMFCLPQFSGLKGYKCVLLFQGFNDGFLYVCFFCCLFFWVC